MPDPRLTIVHTPDPGGFGWFRNHSESRRLRRLLRSVEADWVVLALESDLPAPRILGAATTLPELAQSIPRSARRVVFCRFEIVNVVVRSLREIGRITARFDRFLLLLPRSRRAPRRRKRGRHVDAFACDSDFLGEVLAGAAAEPESLCYQAAVAAMECPAAEFRVFARQLPVRAERAAKQPVAATVRIVIPHRGDADHLRSCLVRMRSACREVGQGAVHVAIDQELTEPIRAVISDFPEVRFWQVSPTKSGPYVPRHLLGTSAEEEYVVLQDSDDVPTCDRLRLLLGEIRTRDCDLAGSHVLDIDESERKVYPYRYPLDAVKPMKEKPQNTVFHPTIGVRTRSFVAAGGLSTVRRFASDREFNVRAYFLAMKMRNVDRFLYLRRLRADSLIHDPATGMQSEARRSLHVRWQADFELIQQGKLEVAQSSLAPSHLDPLPRLIPIRDRQEVP